MRRQDSFGTTVVWLVVVVGILPSGGRTKADFTFGEPTNLGPTINTSSSECVHCLSADGLEMYISTGLEAGDLDIWVARRATTGDSWGSPENLGPPINSLKHEIGAQLSLDGTTLYFASDRGGNRDIWVSNRKTKDAPWETPVNLGSPVNSPYHDGGPCVSSDDLELYFWSLRPDGHGEADIWITTRSSVEDPWSEPENLSVLNSANDDGHTCLSPDGLVLFFESDRPDGNFALWMTRRASRSDPWTIPINLGPVINRSYDESFPVLSPDERMLYFSSTRPGGLGGEWGDIWKAPVLPVVDFNGDGRVGGFEFTKLVDHWGMNEPLCDIGPLPWGDGVVDGADLTVLMQHLEEDTPVRVVVDNFESYNDDVDAGTAIFHAWIDGAGYKQPAPAHPGNGTGALVGNWPPPFAEQVIVHGGLQSLPLRYDNDGTVWDMSGLTYYAETQRTWDDPQDWTLGGADMLTLWIHGQSSNRQGTPEPLYIALQDSTGSRAMVSHPNPNVMSIETWQPWSVNLADFADVDLTVVTMLGIGVGDPDSSVPGGTGLFYIDDIELYPSAGSYDPTLMAHWALDETEGSTAMDSAGENHAQVIGDATWLPNEGMIDGALLLDGVDDCVATGYVRDPSEGSLSILAWVKGGSPGQVVVSQILGANWLMADSFTGHLMTDLRESGRSGKALLSDIVITDGNWHRVGLAWDGINRILYVDDVMVATDTPSELVGSNGGLNIGCDKNQTPDSFWSGMIDDVRVYNRAVKP